MIPIFFLQASYRYQLSPIFPYSLHGINFFFKFSKWNTIRVCMPYLWSIILNLCGWNMAISSPSRESLALLKSDLMCWLSQGVFFFHTWKNKLLKINFYTGKEYLLYCDWLKNKEYCSIPLLFLSQSDNCAFESVLAPGNWLDKSIKFSWQPFQKWLAHFTL